MPSLIDFLELLQGRLAQHQMINITDLMQRNLHQQPRLLSTGPLHVRLVGRGDILLLDELRPRDMCSSITARQEPAETSGKCRAGCLAYEDRRC